MKKVLKVIGVLLLIFVAAVAIALLYLSQSGLPNYPTEKLRFVAKSSPAIIARGEKLSMMLCASCHLDRNTKKFTGKLMKDAPAEFGKIYSQNITQDVKQGIGAWTDGELLYLLRTGIKRDGSYAPPYMAKLPNMADEDLNAIIAFLRSDHPSVVADATPDQPCEPSLLTKVLSRVAFKPFPLPSKPISMPDTNNAEALGKYLAINLDCFSCHSADFKTVDYLNPENSPGYFAGGNMPLDEEGRVRLTANLTPDVETGIGGWTEQRFIKALKYGQRSSGPALHYPMLPYTQLTDKEAGAIFTYLQTIPAIKNKVVRSKYE